MIELQPFAREDFPQMIAWATSAEFLMQWCGWTFTYPLDNAQLERYIRTSEGEHPSRRIFRVVYTETGKVIGHLALSNLDPRGSLATIACVLVGAPHLRGKGIGAEMVSKALDIAFDQLHLHRVELNVFDFNTPAIALYEKLGFTKEGYIREARKVGDQYWNHYHMGILENEWRARRK
jgi:RimJ/RimL family protein N-acetyltransferase